MSHSRRGHLRILHGSTSGDLAQSICAALQVAACPARVATFANGEVDIKINESIRGDDVFIVQSTCSTETCGVNRSVMELLLLIHTLKLSSAKRITAVIPHYGYARQDRKTESRVPISASAVAKMITEMGVNGIVTVDLHCGQFQGLFHGYPMADLTPSDEFADYGKKAHKDLKNLVVVAPDAGAVTRARRLADKIGAERIVTILKRRVEAGKVEAMQLVGSVQDCVCIIVDDMIDTGGTLCKAATELVTKGGAKEVHAYATHGILTDPACSNIMNCDALVEVVVTDSLPQEAHTAKCSKLKVISLAPLLADAIRRIHSEESMEHVRNTTTPAGVAVTVSPEEMPPPIGLTTALPDDDEEWSLPK